MAIQATRVLQHQTRIPQTSAVTSASANHTVTCVPANAPSSTTAVMTSLDNSCSDTNSISHPVPPNVSTVSSANNLVAAVSAAAAPPITENGISEDPWIKRGLIQQQPQMQPQLPMEQPPSAAVLHETAVLSLPSAPATNIIPTLTKEEEEAADKEDDDDDDDDDDEVNRLFPIDAH